MVIKNVKRLLSFLLILVLLVGLFPSLSYADDNIAQVDVTNAFKDPVFLRLIQYTLGKKSNERVYSYEVAQIKKLTIITKPKSLEGLQWLQGLESLSYNGNLMDVFLTSIDLSGCKNLKKLFLDDHKLGKLDLSKNVQLEDLVLNNCNLTGLDLSNNTKLT